MAKTILLADDSITIQKIVNLTFSGEGIDVVAVSNGDAALKKAQEIHPDLILADIFMPGENGYELCENVKRDPALSHTPVILLVGAYEPFDQNEATRVKADGHLTKPFEIRVLISAVTSLIAKTEQAEAEQLEMAEPASGSATAEVPIEFFVEEPQTELATAEPATEMTSEEQLEPAFGAAASFTAEALPKESAESMPSIDERFSQIVADSTEPAAPVAAVEEADLLGISALEIPAAAASGDSEVPPDSRQMVIDIWEAPPAAVPSAIPEMEAAAPPPVEEGTEFAAMSEARSAVVEEELEPPAEPLLPPPLPPPPLEPAVVAPADQAALVDLIVQKVIEKLSKDAIERVAWEVIPDLAELMIKEHLSTHMDQACKN
jgi:CheY-like chemotaxis protein